jgi:hypothetical protein
MASRVGRLTAVRGFGGTALVPPAAFVVHQLRYLLAYGSASGVELQRTGHSYLHSVVPWLVMLIALTAGCFLRSLGRAFSGETSRARFTLSFTGLWLACAGSLVAIFAGQEFLEGLFATGHPAGLAGIFGYGGWWAVPVAVCVGLVLAAVFHGARWAAREVARRFGARSHFAAVAPPVCARPRDVFLAPVPPLLAGWSSRGPPGWRLRADAAASAPPNVSLRLNAVTLARASLLGRCVAARCVSVF